jgi:hypothetical protein
MPKPNWGGKWTESKLDTFIDYVKAYLTILNSVKNKYDWKTIYFDGFAGGIKRALLYDSRSSSAVSHFDLLLNHFNCRRRGYLYETI